MEFEKTLYRIHERLLNGETSKKIFYFCSVSFATLSKFL